VQYNFTVIKRHKKRRSEGSIEKRCVLKRNQQACNHQNTPKNATFDYSQKKVYVLVGH